MSAGTESQAEQLVAWLRRRSWSQPVITVETHISILAFHIDRVYKLKKAVRFAFIDLSTPEHRLADCEREVALNRRLAPDVYLGVEAVTNADGYVVDHVVVMRRMPEARRPSSLAAHGTDAVACIDRLAALMARFHSEGPTGGAIDAAATRDAVARLWQRELAEFPGTPADIAPLVRRYLEHPVTRRPGDRRSTSSSIMTGSTVTRSGSAASSNKSNGLRNCRPTTAKRPRTDSGSGFLTVVLQPPTRLGGREAGRAGTELGEHLIGGRASKPSRSTSPHGSARIALRCPSPHPTKGKARYLRSCLGAIPARLARSVRATAGR
jgi:hypothetical protein